MIFISILLVRYKYRQPLFSEALDAFCGLLRLSIKNSNTSTTTTINDYNELHNLDSIKSLYVNNNLTTTEVFDALQ